MLPGIFNIGPVRASVGRDQASIGVEVVLTSSEVAGDHVAVDAGKIRASWKSRMKPAVNLVAGKPRKQSTGGWPFTRHARSP